MKKYGFLCVIAVLSGTGFLSADEGSSSSERRAPLVKQITDHPPNPLSPGTERKIEKVWYDKDHVFSETDLFSDINNGFYKTYHRNSQLRSEVRYKNGWLIYDAAFDENGKPLFRDGEAKDYYADGTLSEIGYYKNNLKDGEAKYFYYDGKTVVDVWHYMDGRQVGIHTRNNAGGNFVYQEDWGYPTSYVEKLQKTIKRLEVAVGFLVLLMIFIFWKRHPI